MQLFYLLYRSKSPTSDWYNSTTFLSQTTLPLHGRKAISCSTVTKLATQTTKTNTDSGFHCSTNNQRRQEATIYMYVSMSVHINAYTMSNNIEQVCMCHTYIHTGKVGCDRLSQVLLCCVVFHLHCLTTFLISSNIHVPTLSHKVISYILV